MSVVYKTTLCVSQQHEMHVDRFASRTPSEHSVHHEEASPAMFGVTIFFVSSLPVHFLLLRRQLVRQEVSAHHHCCCYYSRSRPCRLFTKHVRAPTLPHRKLHPFCDVIYDAWSGCESRTCGPVRNCLYIPSRIAAKIKINQYRWQTYVRQRYWLFLFHWYLYIKDVALISIIFYHSQIKCRNRNWHHCIFSAHTYFNKNNFLFFTLSYNFIKKGLI